MDRAGNIPFLINSTKDLFKSDLKLGPWSKDQIGLVLSYLWLNIILKNRFKPLISGSFEMYRGKKDFDLRIGVLLRSKTKNCFNLKKEITKFGSFSSKLFNLQVVFFYNLSRVVLLGTLLTSHTNGPCSRIYKGWGANVNYKWYLFSKGN